MPKLKPSPIAVASETVMRNICAQGAINGCKTDTEIAKKIGMSRTLFSERKRNPRLLKGGRGKEVFRFFEKVA